MSKILIVEDEKAIAQSIEYNLMREGFEVALAYDGEVGLSLFEESPFDLVILDIMLPSMNGTEILRRIRASSDVPVIMLTAKDQELDKVAGLETGADDYLTKPFSMIELIARVKAILRRSPPIEDLSKREGQRLGLDTEKHQISLDGEALELPLMEYKLLELFITKTGKALSRERIIASVWGDDFFGSGKTLDVHVKRLRGRIEVDPKNPEHIITIRGVGYRFEDG